MRLSLHPTARLQTWGIAILRVVVGSVFLVHGAQKLFMLGIPAVAAFMTHIGMPLPMASARLLTVVEFFCGLALRRHQDGQADVVGVLPQNCAERRPGQQRVLVRPQV